MPQDKVKINSLSMVAEDHATSKQSAAALYDCIRKPLISSSVSRDRKLPLVYVLDSILKNVKGQFIPLVEKDAKTWMPIVYKALPEDQGTKLKRVWNMWKEFHIFSEASWKEMGECFSTPTETKNRSVRNTIRPPLLFTRFSLIFFELVPLYYRRMEDFSFHSGYERKCRLSWMTCKAPW